MADSQLSPVGMCALCSMTGHPWICGVTFPRDWSVVSSTARAYTVTRLLTACTCSSECWFILAPFAWIVSGQTQDWAFFFSYAWIYMYCDHVWANLKHGEIVCMCERAKCIYIFPPLPPPLKKKVPLFCNCWSVIPPFYFEVTKLKVITLWIHCKPGIKRKCSLLKVDIPIDLMILRSQGQRSTTIFRF